jgi:hypothetical protein
VLTRAMFALAFVSGYLGTTFVAGRTDRRVEVRIEEGGSPPAPAAAALDDLPARPAAARSPAPIEGPAPGSPEIPPTPVSLPDPSDLDAQIWRSPIHYALKKAIEQEVGRHLLGNRKCRPPDFKANVMLEVRGDVVTESDHFLFDARDVRVLDGPALPETFMQCLRETLRSGVYGKAPKQQPLPAGFEGSARVNVGVNCGA